MDTASAAKQSDLNSLIPPPLPPPQKKNVKFTQNTNIFFNQWVTSTPLLHTGMCGSAFMVWNYVI